ncbi:MAG: response regulator transcription factor [Alphaproteobacteria bacterium]|nr:response regulator transcription factor [Alphaproteobacteria bacterium]
MLNVLIVSENEAFKQDLCAQILAHAQGYACNETLKPDIVVLDEQYQLLDSLQEKYERVPVFVLLKKGDKKREETPFIKYVSKPFSLSVFLNLIQSAIHFILSSDAGVLTFNGYELSAFEKEIKNLKTGEKIKLTEREVSMLLYLYKTKDKPISKTEFLEEVWGYSPDVSTHTIETHIYRLRQKVEKDKNWPELISTENGGYKLIF